MDLILLSGRYQHYAWRGNALREVLAASNQGEAFRSAYDNFRLFPLLLSKLLSKLHFFFWWKKKLKLLVFLQLLSSDEMWMYAPIAYNGMNIGIDLNLSQHW